MAIVKRYTGRVPACGVFCGACPVYTRDKKPCPGAETSAARCDRCKSFHLCCQARGVSHCCDCSAFPCRRFRDFARSWTKYGQDLIENQRLLLQLGSEGFLERYNSDGSESSPSSTSHG